MEQGGKMDDAENPPCPTESSGNIVVYATDGNPVDLERIRMSVFSLRKAIGDDVDIYVLEENGIDLGVPGAIPVNPRPSLDSMGFSSSGWRRKWPYACMFRLAIPFIPELSQFDRVLYLDTDTIVHNDGIMELFDMDDGGHEMACAKDVNGKWNRIARTLDAEIDRRSRDEVLKRVWGGRSVRGAAYVNSGVAVMFNDNMLSDGGEWYRTRMRAAFDAISRGRLRYPDQDIINAMLDVDRTLNPKFNSYSKWRSSDKCIEHFISKTKDRQADAARELGYCPDVNGRS